MFDFYTRFFIGDGGVQLGINHSGKWIREGLDSARHSAAKKRTGHSQLPKASWISKLPISYYLEFKINFVPFRMVLEDNGRNYYAFSQLFIEQSVY